VAERKQLSTVAQWSYGTRFVQETINSTYHEAIKMSSYEALTGNKPRCGLQSQLPDEFLNKVRTAIDEEDPEVLLDDSSNQEPGSNSVEELQC